MWFRRGQKNRRLHRGHVLDVKLRSDRVRATRTRLAFIATSMVLGTAFGLYLLWRTGEWALDKLVYENAEFAIQNVEVRTDGVIAPEQLRRWSGVKPGENLIALDLSSVKRNLELVPAVDSVSVERLLPCTLKIRVKEREPVAQVNVPRADAAGGVAISVFELDAGGFVMQPLDPRLCLVSSAQMNPQLPLVTGLDVNQLQPGHRIGLRPVQAALQLVGALKQSPMAGRVELRSIDVSAAGVIVATTGEGGQITFGLDKLGQQLARWRKIYDLGMSRNQTIASLDLAVGNNVPVRWAEIISAPAATQDATPMEPIRRKNV